MTVFFTDTSCREGFRQPLGDGERGLGRLKQTVPAGVTELLGSSFLGRLQNLVIVTKLTDSWEGVKL